MHNKIVTINESKNIMYTNNHERKQKLKMFRKLGFDFPNTFKKKSNSKEIFLKYNLLSKEKIEKLNIIVSIAGRIIMRRIMGKSTFIKLQDMLGTIQLYITKQNNDNNFYVKEFKKWDIGDIIGVIGKVFKTKTGELSIFCSKLQLLTKSLRSLPDKYHGLSNKELCYRQRYLDLIANEKSKNIFILRSQIITIMRKFFIIHNFLEVETPMMHNSPGGANAKPFETYHNALNTKFYLRIAPELYLKQLIIGGFERIFEINRCFRNEGISLRHNPEFTMIEIYMAYSNYEDMMLLIENLFKTICKHINGNTKIQYGEYLFEFKKKFQRFTMQEAILKFNSFIKLEDLHHFEKTTKICNRLNIKIEPNWSLGHLHAEIFEKTVEKQLIQPTFITQYPIEISPLAKKNNENPHLTDRFELFIAGLEIGNGFSELNDPEDQKIRFNMQHETKLTNQSKNNQNTINNTEYIKALEYGLPPTSGLGIGIDRLIMLFTNSKSIRDVIFFPTLRRI